MKFFTFFIFNHFKFFHFHQIHCFNYSISSSENTPCIITPKKALKNSKSMMSLVSRFYGTLSIQWIFSFVKLLQCRQFYTELLISSSFGQGQKQLPIDDSQSWYENYRSIPEKYSWWNTIFALRWRCAPGYFPKIFRTTSCLNNFGRPFLSSPSLLKAFVSLKCPWLPVTEFTYVFD